MQSLGILMGWLAGNGFSIVALFAGVIAACVLWERAPRPALLLLIASLLNLLMLVFTAWYYVLYLPQQVAAHSTGFLVRQGLINTVVSLSIGFFHAIAYALMIVAVVDGRQRPSRPPEMPWR